jgi:small-conductance mechanosensitive channel
MPDETVGFIILAIVAAALIAALLTGYVAQRKGLNGAWWLVVALVIWFVPLFVVLGSADRSHAQ